MSTAPDDEVTLFAEIGDLSIYYAETMNRTDHRSTRFVWFGLPRREYKWRQVTP